MTTSLSTLRDGSAETSSSVAEANTTDGENYRSSNFGRIRHRITNLQTSDPGGFDIPTIDQLLETFFTIWHPRWPVLHRPSFDWQTAPWDLVWVIFMTAAKLQSDGSHLASTLHHEMATVLKEEIDQTLEKGLSAGVAAEVEEPEFLPRMQTYVLYVLFVLHFGSDVEFAHADRLIVGIIQLLHKSEVFHHPILHEQSTVGSVARITQESWRMFAHPMLKTLRMDTDITQGHLHRLPLGCLCVGLAQTTSRLEIPRAPLSTTTGYLAFSSCIPRRRNTANYSILENSVFDRTTVS
jgi:hypothetical protein